MPQFEYKVIPAPVKAGKAKGVKTSEGRFAHTVEGELNRMGEAGWEYLRAELLPQEERSGLKAAQTKWRTVLVFRRLVEVAEDPLHARVVETPVAAPEPMPVLPPVVAAESDPVDPPLTADDTTVVPLPTRTDDEDETPR
ncbi:MAG: DUF4177 domain-containing protein [Paracoccaceae bacterium]